MLVSKKIQVNKQLDQTKKKQQTNSNKQTGWTKGKQNNLGHITDPGGGLISGGEVPLMLTHKLLFRTYPCVLNTEVSSFHCTQVSGYWNRRALLYTEVSSFQGVRIEEFHCIQRCPHFMVV